MMLELDLVQVGWVVHNNLYAIKMLQSKGLDKSGLHVVCQATVVPKLVCYLTMVVLYESLW